MAAEQENQSGLSLKAVVDKEKNKVIFVESDDRFVDVLFSFLTMPLGTIIKLAHSDHSMPLVIGCLKNLYASVENIDLKYFHFHSEAGKVMLLNPRSEAESLLTSLELKIDNFKPTKFFRCAELGCSLSRYKLYSHHRDVLCKCGRPMNLKIKLTKGNTVENKLGGVFVNGMTRFIISDELQVAHMSTVESFSLLTKHGIRDGNSINEMTFNVGADEVPKIVLNVFTADYIKHGFEKFVNSFSGSELAYLLITIKNTFNGSTSEE